MQTEIVVLASIGISKAGPKRLQTYHLSSKPVQFHQPNVYSNASVTHNGKAAPNKLRSTEFAANTDAAYTTYESTLHCLSVMTYNGTKALAYR